MQKFTLCSILFLVIFLTDAPICLGQDRIYTIEYEELQVRIKKVSAFKVYYYEFEGTDSALHTRSTAKIRKIVYEDGHTWTPKLPPPRYAKVNREVKRKIADAEQREETLQKEKKKARYSNGRRNLLTMNFPQFHAIGGLIGLAGGIGYERFLDSAGYLSIRVPLYYHQGTNGSSGSLKGIAFYETCKEVYIIPGIHFHPFGNRHRNDLSIGLSSLAGIVNVTEHFNKYGREVSRSSHSIGILGIMGQLIYRVIMGRHGVFGLELGYGSITSRTPAGYPGIFQFGLKIGGRF